MEQKSDELLIRQLYSLILQSSPHIDSAYNWKNESFIQARKDAILAAQKRLSQEKECND